MQPQSLRPPRCKKLVLSVGAPLIYLLNKWNEHAKPVSHFRKKIRDLICVHADGLFKVQESFEQNCICSQLNWAHHPWVNCFKMSQPVSCTRNNVTFSFFYFYRANRPRLPVRLGFTSNLPTRVAHTRDARPPSPLRPFLSVPAISIILWREPSFNGLHRRGWR